MENSEAVGRNFLDENYRKKILELLEMAFSLDKKFSDDEFFFPKYTYLINLLNNFFNNQIIIIQAGHTFETISRTERFKYALKYKDNPRHYQLPKPD